MMSVESSAALRQWNFIYAHAITRILRLDANICSLSCNNRAGDARDNATNTQLSPNVCLLRNESVPGLISF